MSKHLNIGQKPFQYQVDRLWVKASYGEVPVGNCHGIVEDRSGRIYLLNNHPANNVIVLNHDGEVLNRWGSEYPQAHGLEISTENGEEFLWITDCERGLVVKTTLEGEIILSVGFDQVASLYEDRKKFSPTNVAVTNEGDFYLSDGYGDSWIHHFDPLGKYIHSFGGFGKSPGNLNQAHAVWYDGRKNRTPSLLVCSRMDHAIKRFTLSGEWIETYALAGFWPCNIHYSDGHFYIPHLINDPYRHGAITIHDDTMKAVACLGAEPPVYQGGVLQAAPEISFNPFVYPHDLHVDRNENIYIAQWYSGGTYPIRLKKIVD